MQYFNEVSAWINLPLKYPWAQDAEKNIHGIFIVGTFIEPMCQMQENYRCLISNPIRGWLCSSLKFQDKSDYHPGNLTHCCFVPHPFPDSEGAVSGRVSLWDWLERWSSCAHWVSSQCRGQRVPWLKAPQCVLHAKTVFPWRAHSLFLTAGTKTLCCPPACGCGQRGRTQAVSEPGSCLPGVSH